MARIFSFRWFGIATIGAALALSTPSAQAQLVCGVHSDVVAGLARAFQEKQAGYGVVGQAAIVEIFVSASGSWTMLITDVKGRSCILAAGEGWENNLTVASAAHGI
ncbi:hypothetical protein [Mesorhizobium comanense]|uniref:hypothetical protein n=1 Tax=Mesorhizobium comanense TaxID=2502215 RepID=UPI0010F48740|nr:hypothetical protein [Mesorhizobium comanense]